jgi:WD40 repeat protein/tRNA A-37 threonylcarbamoyl transferase component Bud32
MATVDSTPSLEELLRDQSARWAAGDRVGAEFYLDRHPDFASDPRLIDLVYNEIILRERAGDRLDMQEFQRRFPQIASELQIQWELDREFLTARPSTESTPNHRSAAGAHPRRVGDYEIMGVLGRGGMGIVYRAVQKSLNRDVALKMLRSDGSISADRGTRFRAEAEAVARLHHPNIVQIYEVGEHAGRPYLALEFVDGGSLDRTTHHTPQAPRSAAAAIETLARAIHHAHQRGVIHRDLKPSNILLQKDGEGKEDAGSSFILHPSSFRLKIADFGLAKLLDAENGQTRTGQVFGTPAYMAPEQATGRAGEAGVFTDVYALGAILYELLTGSPPFAGDSSLDVLRRVATVEPTPPRSLVSGVPRDLEVIVLKCLRKEPERRYPSAEALADDLRRFLDGRPIEARPVGPVERAWRWCRRNRWLAGALGLAAGLLVAVTVVSLLSARQAREHAGALGKLNDDISRRERQARHDLAVRELEAAIAVGHRDNDGAACFLGLTRALATVPEDDTELAEEIRLHLGAWQWEFPRPEDPLPEHPDGYRAVFESPDESVFLAVHGDGRTQLWSAESRKPIGPPIRAESLPNQPPLVAFTPDSRRLLTVVGQQVVSWNTRTGQDSGQILAAPAEITALAVEPVLDKKGIRQEQYCVLIGCADGTVRVWGPDRHKPAEIHAPGPVLALFVAPERQLACVITDKSGLAYTFPSLADTRGRTDTTGTISAASVTLDRNAVFISLRGLAFDGSDRISRGQVDTHGFYFGNLDQRPPTLLAAGPNPSLVAMADLDGNVHVQQVFGTLLTRAGSPLRHRGHTEAVNWAPSGNALWTCLSNPNQVRRWRLERDRAYAPVSPASLDARIPKWYHVGHRGLAYAFDGDTLLSWGVPPESVKSFDRSRDGYLGRVSVAKGPLSKIVPSRDGKQFWTVHSTEVRRWESPDTEQPPHVIRFGAAIDDLFLRSDGQEWLTTRRVSLPISGQIIQRWDVGRAAPAGRALFLAPGDRVLGYSQDGLFVLVNRHEYLRRWNLTTGQEATPDFAKIVGRLGDVWRFDNAMYAESRVDEYLTLWNLWTGERVGRIPVPTGNVKPSSDGRYLLVSEALAKVVWDTTRGEAVGRAIPSQCDIQNCEFSPDGKLVAIPGLGVDRGMRVVVTATARLLGPPWLFNGSSGAGTGGLVTGVAWRPHGGKVTGFDGREWIQEWNVPKTMGGSVRQIELWAQVATGARLDPQGNVVGLTAAQWQQSKEELAAIGGPPSEGP